MAAAAVTIKKLARNTAAEMPTATALTSDGALIPFSGCRDDKLLLILANTAESGSSNVTIKAGNGIQGVSDLVVAIAAGKTYTVVVESAKFVNVSGTNAGKVLITGATTDKVTAIELP